MADVSSREKVFYWILIVLIAGGGAAGLTYFFVNGRQARTSLSDVATQTSRPSVSTQSLTDIIVDDPGQVDGGGQGPIIPANNNTGGPIIANNTGGGGPIVPANNTVNRVNQVITAEPLVNRQNQVLTDQPLVTRQNQVLSAGPAISSTTTTATGSSVPTKPPETGSEVLLLSGIASLGISGVASALALRRGRKRSTRAQ